MPNIVPLKQLKRVIKYAPIELWDMRTIAKYSDCGTAHCALGWTMVDPWFIKNTDFRNCRLMIYTQAKEVFGLLEGQAGILFACNLWYNNKLGPRCVKKSEVLRNIDRLIEGKEPIEYEAIKLQRY